MDAIKILRGCGASGKSLVAGAVYAVPGEVTEQDASLLVSLGKAEIALPAATQKPARRKASDD